ncbi:MAG: hypothetical protein LBS40_04605 [Burkholderiales bacterium]|jgi:hypothetical protein|nr:hypothetical protein [Burkholderiales bacterium]
MNTVIRCAALFFLLLSFSAFATEKEIAFDGVMYKKVMEDFSSAIKIVEYIPENETAEKWRHKLSFRHYPHLSDARMAGARLDNVLKQDPANTVETSISRKDKDEAVVVYLRWTESSDYMEYHITRYHHREGVEGLVNYQFTFRFLEAREPQMAETVAQNKSRWTNALANSQWSLPEVFSKK